MSQRRLNKRLQVIFIIDFYLFFENLKSSSRVLQFQNVLVFCFVLIQIISFVKLHANNERTVNSVIIFFH